MKKQNIFLMIITVLVLGLFLSSCSSKPPTAPGEEQGIVGEAFGFPKGDVNLLGQAAENMKVEIETAVESVKEKPINKKVVDPKDVYDKVEEIETEREIEEKIQETLIVCKRDENNEVTYFYEVDANGDQGKIIKEMKDKIVDGTKLIAKCTTNNPVNPNDIEKIYRIEKQDLLKCNKQNNVLTFIDSNGNKETYKDFCYDDQTIVNYYCDENNNPAKKEISCQKNQICENAKCVTRTENFEDKSCQNIDFGAVEINANGEKIEYKNYCDDKTYINYDCENGQIKKETEACSFACSDTDGCLEEEETEEECDCYGANQVTDEEAVRVDYRGTEYTVEILSMGDSAEGPVVTLRINGEEVEYLTLEDNTYELTDGVEIIVTNMCYYEPDPHHITLANVVCFQFNDEFCEDSDGGIHPKEFGSATDSTRTIVDTCLDMRTLNEAYCDGTYAGFKEINCNEDQTCLEGACYNACDCESLISMKEDQIRTFEIVDLSYDLNLTVLDISYDRHGEPAVSLELDLGGRVDTRSFIGIGERIDISEKVDLVIDNICKFPDESGYRSNICFHFEVIECDSDLDCPRDYSENSCNNRRTSMITYHDYRCNNPGTIDSECTSMNFVTLAPCDDGEICLEDLGECYEECSCSKGHETLYKDSKLNYSFNIAGDSFNFSLSSIFIGEDPSFPHGKMAIVNLSTLRDPIELREGDRYELYRGHLYLIVESFCDYPGESEPTSMCFSFEKIGECDSDADCPSSTSESHCSGNDIFTNYLSFNCVNPGTSESRCVSASFSTFSPCSEGEICLNEYDECYPECNCPDGSESLLENNNKTHTFTFSEGTYTFNIDNLYVGEDFEDPLYDYPIAIVNINDGRERVKLKEGDMYPLLEGKVYLIVDGFCDYPGESDDDSMCYHFERIGECDSDADCPTDTSSNRCSGGLLFTQTTSYTCINPGTDESLCNSLTLELAGSCPNGQFCSDYEDECIDQCDCPKDSLTIEEYTSEDFSFIGATGSHLINIESEFIGLNDLDMQYGLFNISTEDDLVNLMEGDEIELIDNIFLVVDSFCDYEGDLTTDPDSMCFHFEKRVNCESNADCPDDEVNTFCRGNSLVTETTSYECENPGREDSRCVSRLLPGTSMPCSSGQICSNYEESCIDEQTCPLGTETIDEYSTDSVFSGMLRFDVKADFIGDLPDDHSSREFAKINITSISPRPYFTIQEGTSHDFSFGTFVADDIINYPGELEEDPDRLCYHIVPPFGCEDSDEGRSDVRNFGYARDRRTYLVDECISLRIINESYCDGSNAVRAPIHCPTGTICNDEAGHARCLPDGSGLLRERETVSFSKTLYSGFNLVSLPVILENNNVENVFTDVDYVGDVFYFDTVTGAYEVASYLEPGVGYWVLISEETQWKLEGEPITSLDLTLNEGWNLIGSLSNSISNPISAHVFGYDPITGYFAVPRGSSLEPGKGYWFGVVESRSLLLE